ncbi:MAG: FAD-binding oxidoreductase [Rubrivivax sp.]|nr:FAD-binding oxidoreductase [Rubrivivax sp.]
MSEHADVAIVGAGIAGAALAHVLSSSRSVLLLEREAQPGQHSTGRSAAMFMESYGSPQGRALTRASRALYGAPPPDFGDAPVLSPRGALYVGWQGQETLLDAMQDGLRATGSTIERLDAAATLARVPVLRAEGLVGALWEADAMDIDVHVLHQGLLRGARRQGMQLLCNAELQQAVHDGHGWTLTLADGRRLRTRHLVNAAGAWADEVARRCGSRALGVQPKRRSAFTFDAPDGVDFRSWPVTAAIAEHWYFKPDAGQLLGSPANADPVPAHDVVAEEIDIASGIAAIEADTTLRIRRPRRTWAGLRSFAPDGEMLIGFDDGGLFWLAGQGGWGIQSAHGAALLAAALLRGEALPQALRRGGVDADALSPRRLSTV